MHSAAQLAIVQNTANTKRYLQAKPSLFALSHF